MIFEPGTDKSVFLSYVKRYSKMFATISEENQRSKSKCNKPCSKHFIKMYLPCKCPSFLIIPKRKNNKYKSRIKTDNDAIPYLKYNSPKHTGTCLPIPSSPINVPIGSLSKILLGKAPGNDVVNW